MTVVRYCRRFNSRDQDAFAMLSGDYNPLHLDAVGARRLIFGAPVVHGMHTLLWALDCWLAERAGRMELCAVRALFAEPLRLDEEVRLVLRREEGERVELELRTGSAMVTEIELAWREAQCPPGACPAADFTGKRQPRVMPEGELAGGAGTLALGLDSAAAAALFPHLTRCLAPRQLAILLGTTRLVGMECPGLRSLYSELSLASCDGQTGNSLNYRVTEYDRRFGMVLMQVAAPGLAGTIKAFVRPEPQAQAGYRKLKELVRCDEFSGQRALVIGGSRGLGEVTAKLLAAGAAAVKLTYHQGAEDAQRVVEEIVSGGGLAESFQYDVLNSGPDFLKGALQNWVPTHLYYFATPFIFCGTAERFSPELFDKFCAYYVRGWLATLTPLRQLGLQNAFYPSSVAIDELPWGMAEYAAAKGAGEMLCRYLEKAERGLVIHRPRFPRLETDQTASILSGSSHDPVPVLLQHLRLFRDGAAKTG